MSMRPRVQHCWMAFLKESSRWLNGRGRRQAISRKRWLTERISTVTDPSCQGACRRPNPVMLRIIGDLSLSMGSAGRADRCGTGVFSRGSRPLGLRHELLQVLLDLVWIV